MVFRFLVAKDAIKGLPGLEKGDAVVRVAVEVMQGGYEYDVWHKLGDGMTAKTRIEHRDEFDAHEVEADTPREVRELVAEVCSRY
jgi:hypothetical protein